MRRDFLSPWRTPHVVSNLLSGSSFKNAVVFVYMSSMTHCTLRGKIGPKRLEIENRENIRFLKVLLVLMVSNDVVVDRKHLFH